MVKRYELCFYEGIAASDSGSFVLYDDYAALEKQLAELQDKLRWRDVREELPDELQVVLVYCKYDREPTVAYINKGWWYEKHEYTQINGDAYSSHDICAVGSDSYDAITH